jgi:hypothetical protein
LEWNQDPKQNPSSPPLFKLKGVEFSPAEIESIVQEDMD